MNAAYWICLGYAPLPRVFNSNILTDIVCLDNNLLLGLKSWVLHGRVKKVITGSEEAKRNQTIK